MALLFNCAECGTEFIPLRATGKFCSYDCCQKWHQRQNRQIRQWWKEEMEDKARLMKELEQRRSATA